MTLIEESAARVARRDPQSVEPGFMEVRKIWGRDLHPGEGGPHEPWPDEVKHGDTYVHPGNGGEVTKRLNGTKAFFQHRGENIGTIDPDHEHADLYIARSSHGGQRSFTEHSEALGWLKARHQALRRHVEPGQVQVRDWAKWDAEHPWMKRPRHRKWDAQDREVMEKAHHEAETVPAGKVHKGIEEMSDAEYRAHRDHVEHELIAHGSHDLMRSPVSTHNSEDRVGGVEGAYTAERKALHDKILAEYDERAKSVPSDRQAIIMGGLGGAGKSSALRDEAQSPHSLAGKLGIKYATYDKKGHGVGEPTNFITVNPDDIKERMAELGAVPKVDELSPMEASVFTHEEASMLASRVAERMQSQGKNVIHDITLNSVGSGEKRISALRQAGVASPKGLHGYHVSGVMVDVSTAHSKASAEARHRGGQNRFGKGIGQGGRYVPSDLILGAEDPTGTYRSKNRAAFETLKARGAFDHTITIDNENYAHKIIAETGSLHPDRPAPPPPAPPAPVSFAMVHSGGTPARLPRNVSTSKPVLSGVRAQGSITERILAYRRGQMELQNLVSELANRDYATPTYMTEPGHTEADSEDVDWAQPDTWGEVQHANDTGLLTDDEYDQIHRAAMAAHGAGQRVAPGVLDLRADPEHDPRSTMVSLDLPEGTITPVPGGLPPDEHHITIVYAGKVEDADLPTLLDAARDVAAKHAPFAGQVAGIGSFPPSAGSDGLTPYFAIPTVPGIEKLRGPLERFNASEHTEFHPHVTLTYGEAGEPAPAPVPPTSVRFTHLSVHRGGKLVARYPFTGIRVEESCVDTRNWTAWDEEHKGDLSRHEMRGLNHFRHTDHPARIEPGARVEPGVLHIRNWAKWHAEHPYIHHPRTKHFTETEHHAHRPTAESSAVQASEVPEIPRIPKADKTSKAALIETYRKQAQEISKDQYKVGSSRGQHFEEGYITARLHAEREDMGSEHATALAARHLGVTAGLQANQARAKREGVAAGYRAHAAAKGAPPVPGPTPPRPPVPVGGNPYRPDSEEAKRWQRAHDFAMEYAKTKGFTAEQANETIERTRLAEVGAPGSASHLTSQEGKEGLLAGYKEYAKNAPSAPPAVEGPHGPVQEKYLKGSPKYRAFEAGHNEALGRAATSGMDAVAARNSARIAGNEAATRGPGVERARAEGMQSGFLAHAEAVDRGWRPSGSSKPPEPPRPPVEPPKPPAPPEPPKEDWQKITGRIALNPELHEKVTAKDLAVGDIVAKHEEGRLYPPTRAPGAKFWHGMSQADISKQYEGQQTFGKITSIEHPRRHVTDIHLDTGEVLSGGNAAKYGRLKVAKPEPVLPPAPEGHEPVRPPVVIEPDAVAIPSSVPKKQLAGVPPVPEIDQPLPDNRGKLVTPQVTRGTGEVREKGPKTNPVIGHVEKQYYGYDAYWHSPDGQKVSLGGSRRQKDAVERLQAYHNGILEGTQAPPARARELNDPPPGGFRAGDSFMAEGRIWKVQQVNEDGGLKVRDYGNPQIQYRFFNPGPNPKLGVAPNNPFDVHRETYNHQQFNNGFHRARWEAYQNRMSDQQAERAFRQADRESSRNPDNAELVGRIAGFETYRSELRPINVTDLKPGNVVGKTENGSEIKVVRSDALGSTPTAKYQLVLHSPQYGTTTHEVQGSTSHLPQLPGAHRIAAAHAAAGQQPLPEDIPAEHVERYSEGFKEGRASGEMQLRRGGSLEQVEAAANDREARGMNGMSGPAYLAESKGFAAGARSAVKDWETTAHDMPVPEVFTSEEAAQAYREAKQSGLDEGSKMVHDLKLNSTDLRQMAETTYRTAKQHPQGSVAQARQVGMAHGLVVAARTVAPQRAETVLPINDLRKHQAYRTWYDLAGEDVQGKTHDQLRAEVTNLEKQYADMVQRDRMNPTAELQTKKAVKLGQIARRLDAINGDEANAPLAAPLGPISAEEMTQARSEVLRMLAQRDTFTARTLNSSLAGAMEYDRLVRRSGAKTPGDVTIQQIKDAAGTKDVTVGFVSEIINALKGAKTVEDFERKAPRVTTTGFASVTDQKRLLRQATERLSQNVARAQYAEDAAKANDFVDAMVEAHARGGAVPTAPKLSMPWRKQDDSFDHFGPQHVETMHDRLNALVQSDTSPIGEFRGLTVEDFARHNQVMAKGNEIAARIDARPDVIAAKELWQEKKAALDARKTYWALSADERSALSSEERDAYMKEDQAARSAAREAEKAYGATLDKATLEEVRKERDIGGGAEEHPLLGEPAFVKGARKALALYPTDWIRNSAIDTERQPLVVKGAPGRGNLGVYQHNDSSYRLSSLAKKLNLPSSFSSVSSATAGDHTTLVHEFGHRMEYTVPGINEMEAAHIVTRMRPDESYRDHLGGYGSGTTGVEDEFAHAYSGRIYEPGNIGRAHELLTTGVEGILGEDNTDRQGRLVGLAGKRPDPRHRAFILGMLASHQRQKPSSPGA